jgi:hypothetical protein
MHPIDEKTGKWRKLYTEIIGPYVMEFKVNSQLDTQATS